MTVADDLATLRRLIRDDGDPDDHAALDRVEAEIARLERERDEQARAAMENYDAWVKRDGEAEAAEAERDTWKAEAGVRLRDAVAAEAEVERLRQARDEAEGLYAATAAHLRHAQAEVARLRDGLREIRDELRLVITDDGGTHTSRYGYEASQRARALLAEDGAA